MAEGPQLGDVVAAAFPVRQPRGHEQEGMRPSVVVGLPDRLGVERFPMLVVVPFTTFKNQLWVMSAPALYPRFTAGAGGLKMASVALLDQVVAIDATRIRSIQGKLEAEQYDLLHSGLARIFGFSKVNQYF